MVVRSLESIPISIRFERKFIHTIKLRSKCTPFVDYGEIVLPSVESRTDSIHAIEPTEFVENAGWPSGW